MAGDGSPYANCLNIGISLDKTGDGFPCEEITAAITAAVVLLAPELLEVDALEGVELQALCGLASDPSSAIKSLTGPKMVNRRASKAISSG
jgi:hypothetical protein